MSKKALLVGINHYANPEWELRGCINDTLDMKDILKTYFGFADQDIGLLHDQDATAQGIRQALGWLLDGSHAGDVRVLHFSGHGTKVPDQSGTEWLCEDEVLVTFDHDWDSPFRDDDLRAVFDPIPAGVNFTFIADCCYSGTIQKALFDAGIPFRPRYLTPPREMTDEIEAKIAKRDEGADAWAAAQLAQMLQGVPADQWPAKMQEYLTLLRRRFRENRYAAILPERHVLLAACEDRQTACECRIDNESRGPFTWALAKAIRETAGDLTYEELITRAAVRLRFVEQRPQLECPSEMRGLHVFAPRTQ